MKKLLLILLLTFQTTKPIAGGIISGVINGLKGITDFLWVTPNSLTIAGAANVTIELVNVPDLVKAAVRRVSRELGNKNTYDHIFGKKNREKHGFKREDSRDMLEEAYRFLEDERDKGTFKQYGKQPPMRKMIRQGIWLVVKTYVSAKGIEIATMYLQRAANCANPAHIGNVKIG
jgi:hypothetical protein